MPGGINDENLEQRIERIRKRDEEIEKKHREAEADRLAALQANAMVKTTAPADDDDWPKAHKYDKLDFTYDVKCEQNADDVDEPKKPTADEPPRLQRPFKKFPEGQGPPSDPKFNFLADAERDGKTTQSGNASNENKNWRSNSNNNNNSNSSSSNGNRRNNSNNSSFNRGRNNGGGKGGKPQPQDGGKKGKSNDEPILRKNDRDQRMQRQKSSDGMWRRPSDETKEIKKNVPSSPTGKNADNRQMSAFKDTKSGGGNKPSIQQRMGQSKPDSEHIQQKLSDLSIEKRGNITVSVTKDGEVKSVKLEAARAIGSGRVGGVSMRNLNCQNVQPPPSQQQFVTNTQPSVVMDPNLGASTMNYPSDLNYPTIDQFIPPTHTHQHQHQPMAVPMSQMAYAPIASVPTQTPAPVPMPTVSTPKPMTNIINGAPFKLPSVQDRLIKNRVYFDENLRNVAQTGNGVGNN